MKKNIHKPYVKFKGWIREHGMTYATIAEFLGISRTTVALKINGQSDFLLSEIQALKNECKVKVNFSDGFHGL